MSKTHHLTFHSDPAHGWLEASMDLLREAAVQDLISDFSYRKGDTAYLEEDLDAAKLLNALKARGDTVEITDSFDEGQSFIRSLPYYTTAHP